MRNSQESAVRLSLDVWSATLLVWSVTLGRDVALTPEAHLFFFDRYFRLAEHHRKHGHGAKARRFQARAEYHYRAAGDEGPYAAAMAAPRPARFSRVNAVARSTRTESGPDAA